MRSLHPRPSSMFPCPLLLGPLFFLFHTHLEFKSSKQVHSLVQSTKPIKQQAKGKRKECLRTIGMGGIGKYRTKISFHLCCWRRKQTGWAFLYVPIPTALRPSLSSSSQLALKSYSIHMLPGKNLESLNRASRPPRYIQACSALWVNVEKTKYRPVPWCVIVACCQALSCIVNVGYVQEISWLYKKTTSIKA